MIIEFYEDIQNVWIWPKTGCENSAFSIDCPACLVQQSFHSAPAWPVGLSAPSFSPSLPHLSMAYKSPHLRGYVRNAFTPSPRSLGYVSRRLSFWASPPYPSTTTWASLRRIALSESIYFYISISIMSLQSRSQAPLVISELSLNLEISVISELISVLSSPWSLS
jgi:hypothetical protein